MVLLPSSDSEAPFGLWNFDKELTKPERSEHRYPLYIRSQDTWKKIGTNDVAIHIAWAKEAGSESPESLNGIIDQTRCLLHESQGAHIYLLIDSEGGRQVISEETIDILRFGRRYLYWKVTSIIANEASSASADIAISADDIIAADDVELYFHHTISPRRGVVVHDLANYHYSSIEDNLNRLQKISRTKLDFEASGIRKKFREIFDNFRIPDDEQEVIITGKELRAAGIIRSDNPVSREELAQEIEAIVDEAHMPKALKNSLRRFQKRIIAKNT